jgi:hypothetical protein
MNLGFLQGKLQKIVYIELKTTEYEVAAYDFILGPNAKFSKSVDK